MHVVAYVVKDQTARTAAKALRRGYFSLFGAPAYLLSDRGAAFTGHVIRDLCRLYGVQRLRTSSYHGQTNGQVERMNQTLIRMIGKLDQDRKACWSKFLPELLLSYNATRSAVTGYSPHFLLFGRRPRIPVDYQFPTIRDPSHKTQNGGVSGRAAKEVKGGLLRLQGVLPPKKLSNNNAIMIEKPGL